MHDLAPSALRRLLMLRRFPILCEAELGELAMFAENITEVALPANSLVATAGARLAALHFVVTGEIATMGDERRTWGPCQVFGGLEVLANREASETAMTTMETTTLQLMASDVMEILDDSLGVMLAALRGLAAANVTRARTRRRACTLPDGARARSLGLVERLMILRQQPAFSVAPLEALVVLAHTSEDVVMPVGTLVTRAGATETSSFVILQGASAAVDTSGVAHQLGPGDAIGQLEALAGQPHDETIEVVEPMRALKVDAARVFDIIEDHSDFGRAVLAVLAEELLESSRTDA